MGGASPGRLCGEKRWAPRHVFQTHFRYGARTQHVPLTQLQRTANLPPRGHESLAFPLLTRVAPRTHHCDPCFPSAHTWAPPTSTRGAHRPLLGETCHLSGTRRSDRHLPWPVSHRDTTQTPGFWTFAHLGGEKWHLGGDKACVL